MPGLPAPSARRRTASSSPNDAKGLKVRSAGATFAQMWAGAGASIVSIPSNEVYNALQNGVADATDTSTGSFVSFRLYEQLKCVTAPGDNALWFMYEPVLMSKASFDKLNPAQQKALMAASKKAEDFFAGEAKKLDDKMVEVFKKADVKVVTMTPAQFDDWRAVAHEDLVQDLRGEGAGRQGDHRQSARGEIARDGAPRDRRARAVRPGPPTGEARCRYPFV